MQAGKLRDRVTIQRVKSAATLDAAGVVDLTTSSNWETLASRWAEVVGAGGQERGESQRTAANITHKITLRWDDTTTTITPRERVVWNSKTLDITAVHEMDGKRRGVVLLCTERTT